MPASEPPPFQNPVVLHVNGLGDRLLALPAVRALAALFPGRLQLVGDAGDHERFYSGLPLRSALEMPYVWVGDLRRFDADALADAVGECDLLVSFNTWHSEDVDRLLARWPAARTLGFARSFQDPFRVDYERHACDGYFDLVRRLDPAFRLESFAGPPVLPGAAVEGARAVREQLPAGGRILALHNETHATKRWPAARLRELLRLFLERHPDWLVFVLDVRASGLEEVCPARVFSFAGLPLAHALALVGVSDAFLGVDSCMLHAADLYRLPGVGLFGPTSWRRWGFRFAPHRHVASSGPMEAIAVREVLTALEEVLPA